MHHFIEVYEFDSKKLKRLEEENDALKGKLEAHESLKATYEKWLDWVCEYARPFEFYGKAPDDLLKWHDECVKLFTAEAGRKKAEVAREARRQELRKQHDDCVAQLEKVKTELNALVGNL